MSEERAAPLYSPFPPLLHPDSLPVKDTACHQPSWPFDRKEPHDSEEECRIRGSGWEEKRGWSRRRVIYRVKEYRIQMCNKAR